jgi:hypothetical protein
MLIESVARSESGAISDAAANENISIISMALMASASGASWRKLICGES